MEEKEIVLDLKEERLALINRLESLKAYRDENGRHLFATRLYLIAEQIAAMENYLSVLDVRIDLEIRAP